ncbi:hypothetical protein CB1_000327032 [Camelus ferus]|nr:hypothetical protein CB1_000327032 [Camelus ferus]
MLASVALASDREVGLSWEDGGKFKILAVRQRPLVEKAERAVCTQAGNGGGDHGEERGVQIPTQWEWTGSWEVPQPRKSEEGRSNRHKPRGSVAGQKSDVQAGVLGPPGDTVGQRIWQRDFPGIYTTINAYQWSETVQPIMEALRDATRRRAFALVSQAYTSIVADDFAAFVGLPVEEAVKEPAPVPPIPNEQQLARLTDYVAFLEN